MIKKVYTSTKDFNEQNTELNTKMPYSEDTSILKESVIIGSKTVPNRLACQAMEGCDGNADGTPAELTYRRYKRLAEGGSGIIWFEATACREDGRANPRQLWIKRDNLDRYKKIVNDIREDAIKANGYAPIIIMQATHSGRYSKPPGFPEPLIAYNNPIFEGDNPNDIEQKARIFTQFKTQNRRSYNITLVRFDETTVKPGYTDETGKYHLPKQRTTATTLFK